MALKSYLEDKHIAFDYIDVSDNAAAQKEMIEATNQMGVPVVEIDGEWIIGFDRDKIAKKLNL